MDSSIIPEKRPQPPPKRNQHHPEVSKVKRLLCWLGLFSLNMVLIVLCPWSLNWKHDWPTPLRGSRRTKMETPSRELVTASVAEESPALPGASGLRAAKDLRPDLKALAEKPDRWNGMEWEWTACWAHLGTKMSCAIYVCHPKKKGGGLG